MECVPQPLLAGEVSDRCGGKYSLHAFRGRGVRGDGGGDTELVAGSWSDGEGFKGCKGFRRFKGVLWQTDTRNLSGLKELGGTWERKYVSDEQRSNILCFGGDEAARILFGWDVAACR